MVSYKKKRVFDGYRWDWVSLRLTTYSGMRFSQEIPDCQETFSKNFPDFPRFQEKFISSTYISSDYSHFRKFLHRPISCLLLLSLRVSLRLTIYFYLFESHLAYHSFLSLRVSLRLNIYFYLFESHLGLTFTFISPSLTKAYHLFLSLRVSHSLPFNLSLRLSSRLEIYFYVR